MVKAWNDTQVDDVDTVTAQIWNDLVGYVTATKMGSAVELLEVGTATYDDVQDWLNSTQSAGRISGGVITAHSPADGTVDISAFKGFIKTTDSNIAETRYFDLAAQSQVALTDNNINYIYVEYNSGTPRVLVTTDRTTIRYTDQFNLGRAFRSGNDVEVLTSGINLYNRSRLTHEKWIDTFGGMSYANGLLTSCTGLKPAFTAGTLYAGSNKISISAVDCNVAGTFDQYYYNPGTTSWVKTTGNTTLLNTQYNKTDTGTGLATTSSNKYCVHWLYICPAGEMYILVGQGDYTLAQAQALAAPALVPNYLSQWAKLAAKIIISKSAASPYSITQAWSTQFPVQVAGDHNDLTGLQGGQSGEYYHLTAAQASANAYTSTKLDDFATPDDNTDLNASTSNHGLVVKVTAPAAGNINVVGVANGETAYTMKTLFDATNPAMNGTAAPGTATTVARRDHVHGSDTSRLSTTDAATATRSVFLSLAGGWTGTTAPDSGFVTAETSTNKVNFRGTKFAASASDVNHEHGMVMPLNWDGGTITAAPVLYTTSTDASSHTIIFSLQGVSFGDGEAMDTAYGTAQTSTVTAASSIANLVKIGAFTSAITIAGTSPTGGEWVQFRTTRVGSDTHTGDVILLGWLIKYTTDSYSDV